MEVIKLPWPGRSQGDSDFMQWEILDGVPQEEAKILDDKKKILGEKKHNSDEVWIFIQ